MSSSATKRHSILPPLKDAGPKAPVRFSSSLIIADSAILTGVHTITLRTESLVHPRARIESHAGPVDVGKRCIVQERTIVGALPLTPGPVPTKKTDPADGHDADSGKDKNNNNTTGVTLRDYCVVEAAAVIESGGTVIGEGTRVGVGSRIGRGAVIGDVSFTTSQLPRPDGPCFFLSFLFFSFSALTEAWNSTAPSLRGRLFLPTQRLTTIWSSSPMTDNGATSETSRISGRGSRCASSRSCRS